MNFRVWMHVVMETGKYRWDVNNMCSCITLSMHFVHTCPDVHKPCTSAPILSLSMWTNLTPHLPISTRQTHYHLRCWVSTGQLQTLSESRWQKAKGVIIQVLDCDGVKGGVKGLPPQEDYKPLGDWNTPRSFILCKYCTTFAPSTDTDFCPPWQRIPN